MVGSGWGLALSQTVSPMDTSDRPVIAQMSPASTLSAGTREKLSYTKSSEILPGRAFSPAACARTLQSHGSEVAGHAMCTPCACPARSTMHAAGQPLP